MKIDNPFDKKLEANKRMPGWYRSAFVDITDTLDFCWAAAQAVFEKSARPEHAIALLPLFLERADAERRREVGQPAPTTDGDTTPRARKPRSQPKG